MPANKTAREQGFARLVKLLKEMKQVSAIDDGATTTVAGKAEVKPVTCHAAGKERACRIDVALVARLSQLLSRLHRLNPTLATKEETSQGWGTRHPDLSGSLKCTRYFASAASTAAMTSGESGVVAGSNRATGFPSDRRGTW